MPNDGVRSSWNGQRPSYRDAPALRSSVRADTSSTKSTASRTRSLESLVYRATAATLAGERLRDLQLGVLPNAVAVCHAREVVGDAPRKRTLHVLAHPGRRRRKQRRVLHVVVEQPPQHRRDLRVL